MKPAKVLIICGSDSDIEIMSEAAEVFEKFSVKYDLTVSSAHRSPDRTMKLVKEAESKGYDLIIAGAGFSAHLAGVTAAHTSLPVLGVPIDSSPLKGIDSLLSTVQMPPGVPVGCMGIGKSGAKNAAHLALRIIGVRDAKTREAVRNHMVQMEKDVEAKACKIKPRKS